MHIVNVRMIFIAVYMHCIFLLVETSPKQGHAGVLLYAFHAGRLVNSPAMSEFCRQKVHMFPLNENSIYPFYSQGIDQRKGVDGLHGMLTNRLCVVVLVLAITCVVMASSISIYKAVGKE